jgi:hypothetical protein
VTLFYQKRITRSDVKDSFPKTIFLYGDNMERKGLGGQAREMRGEPNAFGVPTKHYPTMGETAFFSDDMPKDILQEVKNAIDYPFDVAYAWLAAGGSVVIPQAGLGTGLSQLETRAPKIFAYLQNRVSLLGRFAIDTQEID